MAQQKEPQVSAESANVAERMLTWLLSTVAVDRIQKGLLRFAAQWLHTKSHEWLMSLGDDPPEDFVSVRITPPAPRAPGTGTC